MHRPIQHRPIQHLRYSLYKIIIIGLCGLSLISCDYFNNKSASDDNSGAMTDANSSQFGRETIHIGTDLNINSLQPLSKVYSERTGINIDWVPINTDYNHNLFDNGLAAKSDSENPPSTTASNHADKQQSFKQKAVKQKILADSPKLPMPNSLDMLLVHSAYTLHAASQAHELQPLGSEILIKSIPKQYQDPDGEWYGLSKYARTIVYNKNKVNAPELINYAGLADNKWLGRLCMTAIKQPENQAIAKMMWNYRGRTQTPNVLSGWLTNMGPAMPDDNSILKQIENGRCDVGVVDSDIFWHYAKTNPDTSIRLMWTNQVNRGAMTNTITAGAVRTGQSVGAALDFMEWLVSDEGQALLAFNTSTFPVVTLTDSRINQQAIRPVWTQFDSDDTPLAKIMANSNIIKPEAPEDSTAQ